MVQYQTIFLSVLLRGCHIEEKSPQRTRDRSRTIDALEDSKRTQGHVPRHEVPKLCASGPTSRVWAPRFLASFRNRLDRPLDFRRTSRVQGPRSRTYLQSAFQLAKSGGSPRDRMLKVVLHCHALWREHGRTSYPQGVYTLLLQRSAAIQKRTIRKVLG